MPGGNFDAGSARTVTTSDGLLIDFNSERAWLSIFAPDTNTAEVWLRMSASGTAAVNAGLPLRPGDGYIFEGETKYTGGLRAISASGTQTVATAEF